jgi:signal transduction histidine kinase
MLIVFRKLPLTYKLVLIGIIPIIFLAFFSVVIYREQSQRVALIADHIDRVQQSEDLGALIIELARERKFSFQYAIKRADLKEIAEQREKTDSVITILSASDDDYLKDFGNYTSLNQLPAMRKRIDTGKNFLPREILQFYTDVILRLNTINSSTPSSHTFLQPVYQDLITQRTLSEMIAYLGIIRINIFEALFTGHDMQQTLISTLGDYKTFISYEKEFLAKASPQSISTYNNRKKLSDYKPTRDYIDRLFSKMEFDNTYDADAWWAVSTEGLRTVRQQQRDLWLSVDKRMKALYEKENNYKNATFVFLILSMIFVIIFVSYSINDISKLLRELKLVARKISKGETGIELNNMPTGVIGNLAKSIAQIDKNNVLLAKAADEIGKGNFSVAIKPRSDNDLLSHSIKQMKKNLREFTAQKDKLQQETLELVNKRDEFFSVASHELKTPVTSLKAYTQLLLMDESELKGNSNHEVMLKKMDLQINKLTSLINDLLDTSRLQNGKLVYTKSSFKFDEFVSEIVAEIQLTTDSTLIVIKKNDPVEVNADRDRIGQVLTNLLTNAIRFGRRSEEIIVESTVEGDQVICSVRDFGEGINQDQQDKIFDRFYRVSGNNLHTFPGLGLGLYIAKEIINRHDGKIRVESAKGCGSTFYFELPIHQDETVIHELSS